MFYRYIFCKKHKAMFRNQVRSSHQARPPTGTGMPFAYEEATARFSKASRRVLWLTQPPVCGHRATSPVGHKAYLTVQRLKWVKLYLHLAIPILALCLIIRGNSIVLQTSCILWKISRSRISSTRHVVLNIALRLFSALNGRPATLVVRRRGYTSL
jgi:hypothetical protein